MPDNKKIKGPEDPDRINVNQQYEVDYWTKELKATEEGLRRAVDAVGIMAVDVRAWLEQPGNRWLKPLNMSKK